MSSRSLRALRPDPVTNVRAAGTWALESGPEAQRYKWSMAGVFALVRGCVGLDLLRRSGVIFAINIAGLAMAAAAQVLLARTLGSVEFGFYAYAFAWLSLTSLLATAGFQPSILRFGAIYVNQGQHRLMRRLSNCALLVSTGSSCVLLGVGSALVWGLNDRLQEGLAAALMVGLFATPMIAFTRITGSCLRAHGRHISPIFTEVCLREMAVLIFAVLSLLAMPGQSSAADAIMTVLLASCAALVWLHLRLAWVRPRTGELSPTTVALPVREWLVSSGYLLLFTTANLLQKRVDVLLIGLLLGTTSAGAYSIAIYLAGLTVLPQSAMGFVAAPEIARLHAQGATRQLRRTVRFAAAGAFAGALVIGVAVWLAAPLLPAMIGHQFEEAVWPTRLLVLGHLLNASFGCLDVIMTMTGEERRAANLLVTLTIINVPLLWMWMDLFGLVGAALGTASIVFLFKVFCCVAVYRRTNVVSSIFYGSHSLNNSVERCG